MKKVFFLIFIFVFIFVVFFIDPYKNSEFAYSAIDSWYSYKNGDDDLGKTRRKLENINIIKEKKCKYKEHKNNIYIYECNIVYSPIGETVIPLAKNESIDVIVAITFNKDNYKYRVYSSKADKDVYKNDLELGYGKE